MNLKGFESPSNEARHGVHQIFIELSHTRRAVRKIGQCRPWPCVSEVAKPHLRMLIAPAASTAAPCRAARSDE
jgi:hypothetical protein